MDMISTLALAMGSSWLSGINLYATVATLGLLARFGNLTLPGDLGVLSSPWIIGVAALLYLIEFVADKVPVIDSGWDAIHTFIRVPAGAILAAGALGHFDPTIKMLAFLIGGSLALSSHGTKAATRVALNASPEPVSNIAASVVEDGVAFGGAWLAAFHAIPTLVMVALGVISSALLFRKIIKAIKGLFKKNTSPKSK
jgi:hypothetical protein